MNLPYILKAIRLKYIILRKLVQLIFKRFITVYSYVLPKMVKIMGERLIQLVMVLAADIHDPVVVTVYLFFY